MGAAYIAPHIYCVLHLKKNLTLLFVGLSLHCSPGPEAERQQHSDHLCRHRGVPACLSSEFSIKHTLTLFLFLSFGEYSRINTGSSVTTIQIDELYVY